MSTGTTIAAAIELAFQLRAAAKKIEARVIAAQDEGRERLTPEEWTGILGDNDGSRARWEAATLRAEAEGR
jgi:adenine/guanine phosphoribosyltransferase-like PRPP-binding protein